MICFTLGGEGGGEGMVTRRLYSSNRLSDRRREFAKM